MFGNPETSEFSDSLMSEVEGKGVRSAKAVALSKRQARRPYQGDVKIFDFLRSEKRANFSDSLMSEVEGKGVHRSKRKPRFPNELR